MRRLLLALAAAGVATGAGASLASAGDGPSAGPGRIAPGPSPLPVPQVLLAAAQRLEDAAAAKAAAAKAAAPTPPATRAASATTPATAKRSTAPTAPAPSSQDHALTTADVLDGGIALPPLDAPASVRAIIEAGNAIARTPYKWGGGHGRWLDSGYDCSGSVSFVLAAAGLLGGPLTSGSLMSWGESGPGRWVTIYASPTHVFLEVAGVRFDTGGTRTTGSRWQPTMRSVAGFAVRHPTGL